MTNQNPSVAVIVPCRNEVKYIEKCVRSVMHSDYPSGLIELIVCDGLSDDGSREKLAELKNEFSNLSVLDNQERTTPHALNLGLKSTNADIKIILGAHAEVSESFISESVKALKIDDRIGCAGGIIQNVYENEISEVIGKAMSSPFGVGNAHFRTASKDGFVDTVAFGAYSKEVFESIGYFDEELIRNQDDEFNYRLTKAGFKIYLSRSILSKYYVRASLKKLYRQYFQYGYWKVFVNRKHKSITTIRQLIPFFFVFYIEVGLLLCIIFPKLILLYLAALIVYLFAAIISAFKLHSSLRKVFKTILVFFILHYSYGSGYLKGIWHFIVLRKQPSKSQTKSSR